jgi:hypothetical protein
MVQKAYWRGFYNGKKRWANADDDYMDLESLVPPIICYAKSTSMLILILFMKKLHHVTQRLAAPLLTLHRLYP